MAVSKNRKIQIILLLAAYLAAVLGHLCLLRSAANTGSQSQLVSAIQADKLQDKSGRNGIKLKKIAKTVINRSIMPQKGKAFGQLYVATLLHSAGLRAARSRQPVNYAIASTDLPVKRSYHLRI